MPKTNTRREYVIPDLGQIEVVAIMVFFSLLTVFLLVIFHSGYQHFDWQLMGLSSLFVTWVVLSSAAILQLTKKWLQPLPQNQIITIAYLIVMVVLFMLSILSDWLMQLWSGTPYYTHWGQIAESQFIGLVITVVVMRYFTLRHEIRVKEHAELNARIDALQSRIRPHFLFNSMNTIASLIQEKPDLAEQVVEDMSELFRANLMESRRLVTLNEELELCRRYLDIESIRLGDRLKINWQLDPIPAHAEIPLLTLQPLVENSVYHGIQPLLNGGTIDIQLTHEQPMISIVIKNPLPENSLQNQAAQRGHQIAVDNIHNRLTAVFGSSAVFTRGIEKGFYVVRLKIPDGA
ncbi:MAG: histidine kinase [Pseudomonadales bacterium]|nr:histidine kinase [Pseudomonadales bacterium]